MKNFIIVLLLALAVCADALAEAKKDYPPIALVVPSGSTGTTHRDQFLILVIEGAFISHENRPVAGDLVEYIDAALKAQGASYLGVHIREGVKYGDVVRALDTLRHTSAKSISVSLAELPIGRDL
jgi:biopolymer transport protein ExbD